MDTAYKLGAGRYIQMPGAIKNAGKELVRFGSNVFVIGGPRAVSILKRNLEEQFEQLKIRYEIEEYEGYTTWRAAEEYAVRVSRDKYDIVAGVGGGRIMDLAKAIAHLAKVPVMLIPTSSATCAAYTPMSVMYEENGKALGTAKGNFYHDYEVNGVIVDEDIMVHQPPRYAAAGMLDAMAKYIEIRNGYPEVKKETMNFELYTAYMLAEYVYHILRNNYSKIYHDIKNNILSKEVHDYLYINFVLTGFISGSSKALGQTALAHEMYYAVRKFFTGEASDYLHGEIVGMSLILQLCYNRQENLIEDFTEFMKSMNMPVSLDEMGIEGSEENKKLIYNYLMDTDFVKDTKDNREYLRKSIQYICRR